MKDLTEKGKCGPASERMEEENHDQTEYTAIPCRRRPER